MNPESRLEELNKTMAELQAEIAQAKADIAAAKAVPEPNIQDEAVNLDGGRNLQGNRGADGSLLVAYDDDTGINMSNKTIIGPTEVVEEGFHEMEDGSIMANDVMQEADEADRARADAEMQKRIDDGTFGQKLGPIKIQKGPEDSDIDKDRRMDTTSADLSAGDTDNPQGRNAPQILDFDQRPMGMTEDEGGTSSVNEKDDFWKTEEGYNKAIEMYGEKPAWVKEPTMVYDAAANEYVKIKEEDKEQYEDMGISDANKRLFG